MKIRSLLLAGAVLPFAMPFSSFAQDPAPTGRIVVAQNQECPEGENCEGRGKGRKRAKQQQQEQPAQQQEQPRRQRQQQQEQPAQQQEQPRRQRQQQQSSPPSNRSSRAGSASSSRSSPLSSRSSRAGSASHSKSNLLSSRSSRGRVANSRRSSRSSPPSSRNSPGRVASSRRSSRSSLPSNRSSGLATGPSSLPARTSSRPSRRTAPAKAATATRRSIGQGSGNGSCNSSKVRGSQGEPAEGRPRQDGERPRAGAEGPPAADIDSTVDRQLEAQGDQAEADRVRELRDKARRERAAAREGEPPRDGARAPGQGEQRRDVDVDVDIDIDRDVYRDRDVVERRGGRVIVREGDRNIVRPIVPDEADRLLFRARDVNVDRLPGGRTRTVVHRDGVQVITIRDDYGYLVRRSRRGPDGRDIIIINNFYPEFGPPPRPFIYRPGLLPDLVIRIPPERYIVDYGYASPDIIYETLLAPPVMPVDRTFTLDEVLLNEEVRAYLPRIDLDTITFEFGSSTIGTDQMQALGALGDAMGQVLAENPAEVYLIEGHTDAVGSDNDNLILSDERAESVAVALSQNFDIPAENLVTEGYGEQYLKVPSEGAERQNRRVTVRRITPLLSQSDDPQAGAAPSDQPAGEAP